MYSTSLEHVWVLELGHLALQGLDQLLPRLPRVHETPYPYIAENRPNAFPLLPQVFEQVGSVYQRLSPVDGSPVIVDDQPVYLLELLLRLGFCCRSYE